MDFYDNILIIGRYVHSLTIMGSADFLFTPSMQRVLATTLSHPERSYTLSELLCLAGSGHGSTQQQIEKLLASGVLLEEPRRGRQRSIKANSDFFLFPELKSIMHKTFGVVEPLKAVLIPFEQNVQEAFVFGSIAKGTDTQRSDVDLIVVGTLSLFDLAGAIHAAEHELGRPVHLSLYQPAEWRDLVAQDPVVTRIANGPRLQVLPDATTR